MRLLSAREIVTQTLRASLLGVEDIKGLIAHNLHHNLINALLKDEDTLIFTMVSEEPWIDAVSHTAYTLIPTHETFRDLEAVLSNNDDEEARERLSAAVNTYKRLMERADNDYEG